MIMKLFYIILPVQDMPLRNSIKPWVSLSPNPVQDFKLIIKTQNIELIIISVILFILSVFHQLQLFLTCYVLITVFPRKCILEFLKGGPNIHSMLKIFLTHPIFLNNIRYLGCMLYLSIIMKIFRSFYIYTSICIMLVTISSSEVGYFFIRWYSWSWISSSCLISWLGGTFDSPFSKIKCSYYSLIIFVILLWYIFGVTFEYLLHDNLLILKL